MRSAVELAGGAGGPLLCSGVPQQLDPQADAQCELLLSNISGFAEPGILEAFSLVRQQPQPQSPQLAPAVPAQAPDAAAPGCASVTCGWLHAYLSTCGTGFVYSSTRGRQLEPCSPDGLLHIQMSALGPQLAAVTPLHPGEFAALAARNDSLRLLAWRAAHAWSTPGRPGFGVLELNGGWRLCSLQQLQAVVAASVPPMARQASAPAACPPWAWPGKQVQPAAPQPSCSASASNSSAAICSEASVVGGTPGGCTLRRARAAAAQQQDGEEVTSAPAAKRRRRSAAAAADEPAAPAPLPQFSEGEVALLQSLLGTPVTRHCDAATCPSVSSPHMHDPR